MAKVQIVNTSGAKVGDIDLDDAVFGVEVQEGLLWEVVKAQTAGKRAGTAATKTRSMVRGGGKKPYKQKGTGNARAGSNRSPVFVGGGKVFGPHPRDYAVSVPKKVKKLALREALSLRVQEKKLVILDKFEVEPKTKAVAAVLAKLGAVKALVVDVKDNDKLIRGARNLAKAKWLAPEGLNLYDILNHETLVLTAPTVALLTTALSPKGDKE
ncbi:MAG: 50S ribosomal protein L4 [Deltaproteobacteria bacterium]|nr:50S ribosomal protein L4 [Deltaproteobacteria bacterium]